MNHLISLAQNNIYAKDKDKDGKEIYRKFIELIFLVDQPEFTYTNSSEIVRTRKIERLSFIVNEAAIDKMIAQLIKMKDIDESDLC